MDKNQVISSLNDLLLMLQDTQSPVMDEDGDHRYIEALIQAIVLIRTA